MVLSAQSTTEDYIRAKRKTQFISWEFIKQILKHQLHIKRNKCIYEYDTPHVLVHKKSQEEQENEAEKNKSRRTEKMHQEEEREKNQTNKKPKESKQRN